MIKKLLIFLLSVAAISCNCEKEYHCETLTTESSAWIPQNTQDTIRFKNEFGVEIKYTDFYVNQSVPYDASACMRTGLGFCQCDRSCEARSWFKSISTDFFSGYNLYGIFITETSNNEARQLTSQLDYTIFDFANKIDILNPTSLSLGDSLLSTLQLGGQNYDGVYVQTLDTLTSTNQNLVVWKAYYTKSHGVIGFRERQTQTLFYRD